MIRMKRDEEMTRGVAKILGLTIPQSLLRADQVIQ